MFKTSSILNQIEAKLDLVLSNFNIPIPLSPIAGFDSGNFPNLNLLGFL